MKKFNTLIITGTALMSAVFSTAHAFGDNDTKIYPGSMCVRYQGAHNANTHLSASEIGNPSNQTLYVDCPVINDEDGDGTLDAWFRAVDQSYTANVNCRLYSTFRSGSRRLYWWTNLEQTEGAGTRVQQKGFGNNLGANGVSHYYFSCNIPPKYNGKISYITSYQVRED